MRLSRETFGLPDDGPEFVEQWLAAATVIGTVGSDARGVEQGAGEVVAGAELLGRDDCPLEVAGRLPLPTKGRDSA
jgi:hypothetical protein